MHPQQYTEERGIFGKLGPGVKKLEGKNFYLDNVKKRQMALLLEAISLLGGGIESFLHKDVNFVVTGSQEGPKEETSPLTNGKSKGTIEKRPPPCNRRDSLMSSEKQRPGTPRPIACGSRGKALLEKAIRNNERLQGSSVLASARSWGVKILYVDDVLYYLKQLTRESFSMMRKPPEKTCTKQQVIPVVKASALRSPYLKIEDVCRKYKPLHMQSMTFPTLCYIGRFSPFEVPPPRFDKPTEEGERKTRERKKAESSVQEKSQSPLTCNPPPWRPRKKETSYCECCHQPFTNLEEHLQSDKHRAFVLDPSSYSVVDQLVAEMLPGFITSPAEETLTRPPTPLPMLDTCELEPLTDDETERAVKALRCQGSAFVHIFSPAALPLSNGPASPSPEVQHPVLNPEDIQPLASTENPLLDLQHCASSPVMPVLEPQARATPGPETPSSDPYSLPPVLSPQIPCCIRELHSPYSDPPVLSPQQHFTQETVDVGEMDIAESETVFVSRPPSASLPNTDVQEDAFLSLCRIICSRRGLEWDEMTSCQSRSPPRQSATAPNLKKRCRSASSDCNRRKRRRITGESKPLQESLQAESEIIVQSRDSLLLDKAFCQLKRFPQQVSHTDTVESLDLKQDLSTACAPVGQNFTWELNGIDIVSCGSAHVPAPSKTKTLNPPQQLPNEKAHRSFSSQDSQHLQSHSTSVCIDSALIPDLDAISPSSSDSDWDCDLVSRLGQTSETPPAATEQSRTLDKELLQKPCTWMHDTSYESHLHTVLQPSEMDPSVFSRTVVPVVEVQH